MNHIIVRETASEIRAIARGALKGSWPVVIAAMAVYYIMTTTIPDLLGVLIPSAAYTVYNEYLQEYITISYVGNLYNFVLSGAFSVGLCSFLLAFFRRRDGNPAHIFNGFEVFLKSFALMVMQSIFIFLWSLLLVIPGIIAALRYSQIYYILAEHPEKGVMQCIRESKFIMTGNKGKFLCLLLSFIGWWILSAVITVLIPTASGVLGVVIDFVASVPMIAVMAYVNTAQVVFYDLATEHLAPKQPEFSDADYHF